MTTLEQNIKLLNDVVKQSKTYTFCGQANRVFAFRMPSGPLLKIKPCASTPGQFLVKTKLEWVEINVNILKVILVV